MPNYQRIHDFAVKYQKLYENPKTTEADVSEGFAEQCFALGFEMDCGKSFMELFPNAPFYSPDALAEIIDEVGHTMLLGGAIFSRWRYVTHWADFSSLLDERNRKWFAIAFKRLAIIALESYENQFRFEGTLRKIQITSYHGGFGPMPAPEDEAMQRLTLLANGRVWLSRYSYGNVYGKYALIEKRFFRIDVDAAKRIIQTTDTYFTRGYDRHFATDVGTWDLILTNVNGTEFKTHGSVVEGDKCLDSLSNMIRKETGCRNLLVFDGNAE